MAKRKVKGKRGLPYNMFKGEGESMNMLQKSGAVANNAFGSSNLGGTIGSIGSGITSIAKAGMNNAQIADTSSIQDQIKAQNNRVVGASDNDSLLSEWSSLSMLKDNYSWKDVRGGSNANRAMNTIGGAVQGAATGATVGGPLGAIVGGVIGLGSAIGGWITGNRKAKRAARRLNQQASAANQRALTSFENRASDIDTQNDLTMASNYFDYGGPIFSTGAIGYDLASRDLNNKQMKALGDMRLTSLPNSFNAMPDVNTINTFKDGGELHTHGGDFTNGLTYIDNGGSHEANPFEGVQMGIDPQGVPNLVEEGEVIFNDYVFSNRMKVPKAIRQKYKLRDNITFAEAAKKLSKESEDRPNDPISKRGLESFMSALAESQEEVRIKNEDRRMNRYAKGGKLGKRYDGDGPDDNYMDFGTLASPISYEQLERMINLGIDGSAIPLTGTSEEIDNAITRAAVEKGATTDNKSNLSYLRYVPALMSGISAFTDLFSKPDYSAADIVDSINITPQSVSYNPLGTYLSYKPLDRMFYINQLNKNTAAGRRTIQNTSGGNRAAAMASILAADYNYGENLGKLARQAEEYNQAQKEKVAGFNRQTDMFNSQQSMQAQSANAQFRNDATKMRLAQAEEVAKLRSAAKNAYDTRRSNNLNNFINNLGNIGWEEKQAEWLDNLAKRGALLMNTSGEYTGVTKKNGGKLKKNRRTTYA